MTRITFQPAGRRSVLPLWGSRVLKKGDSVLLGLVAEKLRTTEEKALALLRSRASSYKPADGLEHAIVVTTDARSGGTAQPEEAAQPEQPEEAAQPEQPEEAAQPEEQPATPLISDEERTAPAPGIAQPEQPRAPRRATMSMGKPALLQLAADLDIVVADPKAANKEQLVKQINDKQGL